MTTVSRQWLGSLLQKIAEHDTDYDVRYRLVFDAVPVALACGFAAGVRIDPSEPDWPVVYIELPTGQVSWHMPAHPVAWDGHDTDEKYRRITEWIASRQ